MSRNDTATQKINRNIELIYNESTPLCNLFEDEWIIFEKIETLCHFPLLHGDPVQSISFDEELKQLENFINNYKYNKMYLKRLNKYYDRIKETNDLIKRKYNISL